MIRMLREEPDFAEMFALLLMQQRISDQENIVDQLTNSAEKRLARVLLRLAKFGRGGEPDAISTTDQSGRARQYDRHNAPPRQLFHEQIQAATVSSNTIGPAT